MHYIIIGFGLLVGLYGLYRFFISAELRQISALFLTAAILTVCVSLFYMAITGRLAGAIGLVVAMLPIILSAYHRRRQAKKFAGQYQNNTESEEEAKSSFHNTHSFNLTKKEAYEILGLSSGASDSEINAAHKKLIKKLHPDQDGSAWLTSKINAARDILLKGK
jgi:hypothetical protein